MRTKLTTLAISLSAVMASSVFAGDIKPLHDCARTATTLGSTGTAKDIYQATCPAGTARYEAKVRDQATVAKPVVNIRVTKGALTATRADGTATSGDANGSSDVCVDTGFSSYASVAGGAGVYTVEVFKTAGRQNNAALPTTTTGAETYSISDHCLNSSGGDLGSASPFTQTQNQ